MNTVLLLTDFSEKSSGAVLYGASLFRDIPCRFILSETLPQDRDPERSGSLNVKEKSIESTRCRALIEQVNQLFPSNNIKFEITKAGYPAYEQVRHVVQKEHIGIVIIGTKSVSNIFDTSESTNFAGMCEHFNCNVLLVPENEKQLRPDKIVFAVDFKFQIPHHSLHPLIYFARNLPSEIFLLQISNGEQSVQEAITGLHLIHSMEDIPYTFHMANTKALPQKIVKFSKIHKSIMLVLILNTFKTFKDAFDVNYITQIIYQNKVPLLLIPH